MKTRCSCPVLCSCVATGERSLSVHQSSGQPFVLVLTIRSKRRVGDWLGPSLFVLMSTSTSILASTILRLSQRVSFMPWIFFALPYGAPDRSVSAYPIDHKPTLPYCGARKTLPSWRRSRYASIIPCRMIIILAPVFPYSMAIRHASSHALSPPSTLVGTGESCQG